MKFKDLPDAAILEMFPENPNWPGAKTIILSLVRDGYTLTTNSAKDIDFGVWDPCVWYTEFNEDLIEMSFDVKRAEESQDFAWAMTSHRIAERFLTVDVDKVFDFMKCEKTDVVIIKCRAYTRAEFREILCPDNGGKHGERR